MIRQLTITCLFFLVSVATEATAEDVVFVKVGKNDEGRHKLTGTIVELTGNALTLRSASGKNRVIKIDKVDSYQTIRTLAHAQGNQQFAKNEYAAALTKYRSAMTTEKREWVLREIMASMVWCQRGLKDIPNAGLLGLKILESDPSSLHLECLPIAWTSELAREVDSKQALKWMESETNTYAMLMGASYLLSGENRSDAISILKALSLHKDLRISGLAQAQLWRTELSPDEKKLKRWQASIKKLPTNLQAGPYYLLGKFLSREDKYQQAALALMRPVILNPRDRFLASDCSLRAADALSQSGEKKLAVNLYQEITIKYRDLSAAKEAKRRLENMK